MTRRTFLWSLAAAGAAGAAGTAIGRNVRRQVEVTSHSVHLAGASGVRVVQLTDLHAGRATPLAIVEQAVAQTHDLEPDLVVLTGDYVNHSLTYLPRVRQFVASLPRPCVATLGNHDHWAGASSVRDVLEEEGVVVLTNEHHLFDLGRAGHLGVVGVDDGFTDHDDVESSFAGVDRPESALVLTHDPNTANDIATRGGRLILAGHTHGGQISVPVVTPMISRTVGNRYLKGWYDAGAARLYVNAGLGSSAVRWRVGEGANPEVALFLLNDAATPGPS